MLSVGLLRKPSATMHTILLLVSSEDCVIRWLNQLIFIVCVDAQKGTDPKVHKIFHQIRFNHQIITTNLEKIDLSSRGSRTKWWKWPVSRLNMPGLPTNVVMVQGENMFHLSASHSGPVWSASWRDYQLIMMPGTMLHVRGETLVLKCFDRAQRQWTCGIALLKTLSYCWCVKLEWLASISKMKIIAPCCLRPDMVTTARAFVPS